MSEHTLPILYSFRRCPYAMRARMALQVSGQICQLREILLKDKPIEMTAISPKGTVPVLQLPDGKVLDESLDVMFWALNREDPDGWLPVSDSETKSFDNLMSACDGPFKHHLDRYKYASRYGDCDPEMHRREAEKFLKRLNDLLQDQPYLGGKTARLPDHAIFPFIRQFSIADPGWFDGSPYDRLKEWLADMLARPIFTRIMEKRAPWQPGDSPLLWFGDK